VILRQVVPDSFGGLELDRMEMPAGSTMIGSPHKTGTREYLSCETGNIELVVAGENGFYRPATSSYFAATSATLTTTPGLKPRSATALFS